MADFLAANPLGKDKNDFNVSLMFQEIIPDIPTNPLTYSFNRVKFIKLEADLPEEVNYYALQKVTQ